MPATSHARSGVLLALLAASAASAGLAACRNRTKPAATAEVAMKLVQIPVEGMSCAACAARVKTALTSIGGVADVEVSLGERNARVRFDPSRLSPDQFVAAIKGLGYQAGALTEAR